ncbi:putative aminoglycoside phosphotransferase domain-containing protein [Histoplasma capsulatum G186AR]|uniref:Putative aminoglycoside phosphotransferase domain-containing protein n=1 Tax=Ajellomyces capsulatus TaxID=5037 RepID=A0A8H8CX91_AJECA|nr:putative aminoglycoside phosphotransferase domain-containing protein [Histoplasma capsulatum]QSS74796.1 putative aminoglycoside phosphotransferase domain-containing protein [Histoplasma capsulatum G186AR]
MSCTDYILEDDDAFAGYRWSYFSSNGEGPLHLRAQKFLESTDWGSLIEYAAAERNGMKCGLLPDIGLGYNHMVRIVEFADQVRWVARLRLPDLSQARDSLSSARSVTEYNTIQLVQKETKIPVPQVHAFEGDPYSRVKTQFMLMDCLRGNVGMDLNMEIPSEHKTSVFTRLADIHIEMSTIQLPKIGTIAGINDDGSYRQGPIPGLGGPFETAAEFFRAWSAKVEFGLSQDQLKEAAGSFADELSASASSFKQLVNDLAGGLSIRNGGPFPLCHGDFGHNNIIFDDKYRLLGVIDWEGAFAGPWEISGEFPLTLSIIPPVMDVPWNYDENGLPKDAKDRQRLVDREEYIAMVAGGERRRGLVEGYSLSLALRDTKRQYLASAMRLYQRGKPGWYSKVMECFASLSEVADE